MKTPAEFFDVRFSKISLAPEDFGDRAFRSEDVNQIDLAETLGFHEVADRLSWGSRRQRIGLFLEIFDQECQRRRFASSFSSRAVQRSFSLSV